MNSKKINYIKQNGIKTTVISELFKENELKGKNIYETQAELIQNDIVRSRMLDSYTKTYQKNRDEIDWVQNV